MDSVRKSASTVTLAAGDILFSQGEDAHSFFIVEQGEIEISIYSSDGRKMILDYRTPREIMGEIGFYSGVRSASAEAIGPARLLQVRRPDLLETMRKDAELAVQFIDILCARLLASSDRIKQRFFDPLPARLARTILHLDAKLAGRDGLIHISQAELGDFTGASREGVAKILQEWRDQDWIGLSRRTVSVTNRPALEILRDRPSPLHA